MRVYIMYPDHTSYIHVTDLDSALRVIAEAQNKKSKQVRNGMIEYGLEENGERVCLTRKTFKSKGKWWPGMDASKKKTNDEEIYWY
ncbi:MAG: hypothetical protein IJ421_00360 [Prevotella sp.]|nr:hypothetical protein [Prevotella sp.]